MKMKFDFKDVWDKRCELYLKVTDLSRNTVLRAMSPSHDEAQNLTVMHLSMLSNPPPLPLSSRTD